MTWNNCECCNKPVLQVLDNDLGLVVLLLQLSGLRFKLLNVLQLRPRLLQ